jgi:hypothetical protein
MSKRKEQEAYHAKYPRGGGNTKQPPPGFYSASQAANKLGIAVQQLIKYRHRGQVPFYVPPLHIEAWYPRDGIDAIARQMEVGLSAAQSVFTRSLEANIEALGVITDYEEVLDYLGNVARGASFQMTIPPEHLELVKTVKAKLSALVAETKVAQS